MAGESYAKLERENEQLVEELGRAQRDVRLVKQEIALMASNMMSLNTGYHSLYAENQKLLEENEKLRAELARIKPSWGDAPEWATAWLERRNGSRYWTSEGWQWWDYERGKVGGKKMQMLAIFDEHRLEVTE